VKAQEIFYKEKLENDDLKEWRELNTSWHQFEMFFPLYRNRGQCPYLEPLNNSPENIETYRIIRSCIEM